MSTLPSIENIFLEKLRKDNMTISIFLMNGIKLHGVIDDFNEDVIMLKSAVTQMIFKHAISTIVPSH